MSDPVVSSGLMTCPQCEGKGEIPKPGHSKYYYRKVECDRCNGWGDVSTPAICPHCDEPIEHGESSREVNHFEDGHTIVKNWHQDCAIRAVIGGVNHLKHLCTCCGGTEPPDPPEMTKRQAAKAAAEYFRQQHRESYERHEAYQ